MITNELSLSIAKDAADAINALGQWIAVSFDGHRTGPLGSETIIGIAVFPRASAHRIPAEMKELRSSWPSSAIVTVLFEGRLVNVVTRSKSSLPEAQLIRRIVFDVASERAPIVEDAVPVGPAGRPQPETAWRAN